MPTPIEYRLYLDDSGTKEYAKLGQSYGPTGTTRYFVFGGILLTADAASRLAEQLVEMKRAYFDTDLVEIKSNWLRIPRERNAKYLAPFNITEARLKEFVHEYYTGIERAPLRLLAAVVDKVQMQQKYATPWYAPALAYELIAQRLQLEIVTPSRVAVTIDDMMGATPKGSKYKENLLSHHHQLRSKRSLLSKSAPMECLTERLKFDNSATNHLVQVADITAYNVFRQFVEHGDEWEDSSLKSLPTYEWFGRLAGKFVQNSFGRIQGYGVVKCPIINRVKWRVE